MSNEKKTNEKSTRVKMGGNVFIGENVHIGKKVYINNKLVTQEDLEEARKKQKESTDEAGES